MELDTSTRNQIFLDSLDKHASAEIQKQASDSINAFTRMRIREDGFTRVILPAITLPDGELDRDPYTDKPVKIIDMEPDSPGAITVPFGTNGPGHYMEGGKYRVMFNRIRTPKFTKDVIELRTYKMDLRQIFSDNAIKDIHTEEDSKFIGVCREVVGAENTTNPRTGAIQNKTFSGGLDRDNLVDSLKVMPSGRAKLTASIMLFNNITIMDVLKFQHDEMGGTLAQDMLLKGFTEDKLLGVRLALTIKHDLVGMGECFQFADPKFLGKHFTLEDTTMHIDAEEYMVSFCAYQCSGLTIGNAAGVCRVKFTA